MITRSGGLPPKRRRPRFGIGRVPRRIWPRHRAFVKRHACSIRGCRGAPIEFAHLRTAANSGKDIKPHDWHGISLCREHHRRAHAVGHDTLAQENGMTFEMLVAIAAEFARRSPDKTMREAMREMHAAE